MSLERISFGAGCFWGVEHAFKQVEGVVSTVCGYQGGHLDNPTYEQICQKLSGHAEVVLVEFDNSRLSFQRLLDAFFFMHDPSQLDRQGPDVGPQYRSAIFPTTELQVETAENYIKDLRKKIQVVTTIEIDKKFYSAEALHQNYLDNTPGGYCHIGLDVFNKLKNNQF